MIPNEGMEIQCPLYQKRVFTPDGLAATWIRIRCACANNLKSICQNDNDNEKQKYKN